MAATRPLDDILALTMLYEVVTLPTSPSLSKIFMDVPSTSAITAQSPLISATGFCISYRLLQYCLLYTSLLYRSTGISTCCPSATTLVLALGPDLPRADQLYPGNLGYSAIRILTLLSLLIPAFSLPCSPQLLTVLLRPACNAPPVSYTHLDVYKRQG